jgi:hypothetical protein
MGGSPDKPEMSGAEKAQHAVAAAEEDHYQSNYAPLGGEYLSDSQKDFGDRGRAQASSTVMREGTQNLQLSALGGGTSPAAGALGSALTGAQTSATAGAQEKRDARMAGALGIGRELSADTTSSLSALGRTGARNSISKMQSDLKVSQARSAARAQAVGSLAGAGMAAYGGGGGGGQVNGGFTTQVDTGGTKSTNDNPTRIF